MDKLYGVGITNRYSCFIDNEDADPAEAKDADNERESKKKGKPTIATTAEKENRGKEITSSSSGQPGKELPPPPTKTHKQKVNEKPAASQGPRTDRKGIRDTNTKGSDVRGTNRAAGQQQPQQRGVDANERRQQRPDRPQGDRFPKDRVQGERFQGDKPPGDRYQGDRAMRFNNDDGHDGTRSNRRNDDPTRESGGDFDGRGPRRDGGYFRGGDRGRGQNFRGSRGGGGPGGFRKREFDRQSGSDISGVKAVDKRDGAGSRNWGTYKDDDVEVTGERTNDDSVEEKAEGHTSGSGNAVGGEESTNDQEPAEEQQKLMTLDEWKALQEPRAKPVFNLRKAGEGEDQTQWKKMTLKKKEKDEEAEEEEEEETEECTQRATRQKKILDVNFSFADSRRGFGQRTRPGGRGGSMERGGRERSGGAERGSGNFERGGGRGFRGGYNRGGGGRGGYSREQQQDRSPRQTAPKVDDERDFPSLG